MFTCGRAMKNRYRERLVDYCYLKVVHVPLEKGTELKCLRCNNNSN